MINPINEVLKDGFSRLPSAKDSFNTSFEVLDYRTKSLILKSINEITNLIIDSSKTGLFQCSYNIGTGFLKDGHLMAIKDYLMSRGYVVVIWSLGSEKYYRTFSITWFHFQDSNLIDEIEDNFNEK